MGAFTKTWGVGASQGARLKLEPETIIQKNRIIADGGTVIDLAYMDLAIKTLKQLGIYGNAKLLTDANFGVKKDGSGAVSKLYDISGNGNDEAQVVGASQPIWSLVNGKGVITYDGVNDRLTGSDYNLPTGSTARTILAKLNISGYKDYGGIFSYGSTSVNGTGYTFSFNGLTPNVSCFAWNTNAAGSNSTAIQLNTNISIGMSLNGTSLLFYLNGANDGVGTHIGVNTILNRSSIGSAIDGWGTSPYYPIKGQLNSVSIFNIVLNSTMRTTLYAAGL